MKNVLASAPGKVVLSGEYAVLHGAPAVCMAVNRRAVARVSKTNTEWNSVSAPGYSTVEGRFVHEKAAPRWLQGGDEFPLVDAAWRTLAPSGDDCLHIELDTRAFHDKASGAKLGLGSSAALTVALTAALAPSGKLLDSALRVHRRLQSGVGSGVDVATSLSGGLLEYRMQGATCSSLSWPEGLFYRLVWSGVPASTASKLQRLQERGHRQSQDALLRSAASMASAWRSATTVLKQLPDYIETLREFSDDYDLGIFAAGHDKLVAEALAAGLVYKPCGAGGGDVGILMGTNNEQLDEFLKHPTESGRHVLECEIDMQGVERKRH